MIDVFSKFSAASVINSKHKEVIVDVILKHWIATFGTPTSILSDNGGEFNNELLRDVAELLGTKVYTTAAESPWSNGVQWCNIRFLGTCHVGQVASNFHLPAENFTCPMQL